MIVKGQVNVLFCLGRISVYLKQQRYWGNGRYGGSSKISGLARETLYFER